MKRKLKKIRKSKYSKAYEHFFSFPGSTTGNKDFHLKIQKYAQENFQDNIVNNDSRFRVNIIFFFKKKVPWKIDLDNLAKPILDILSGIIYEDDTQVFKLTIEKKYNQLIEGISLLIEKYNNDNEY